MELGVYSVLDKAVGAYLRPFYVRTKSEAIRSFAEACGDEKSEFCKHPDDYVLYSHGVFDDNSGIFSCGEPERVISARECRADGEAPNKVQRKGPIALS
ncbi:MAG: nonstructural protein [Microviridae sp.]|nr:MAG: nonstructural protein [Microviridae sp.]